MTFQIFGKVAGVLALTVALAGCIDMTMDIDVQSETTGKATVTTQMGADFYPMVKAGAAEQQTGEEGFCKEDGAQLTENADGSATCVVVTEGALETLTASEGDDGAKFTVVSPGVVRAALSTADMKSDMSETTGSAEEMDEETKKMMEAMFAGHTITIRFRGKEITDSNMTVSADKTTAEVVIPFTDLINGTSTLPDEVYAVIKTN